MTSNTHEKGSDDYDSMIEGEMSKMDKEGVWKMVERHVFANRPEVEGVCFVFQLI